MAKTFLSAIDLSNNEMLNMVVQNVASLPTSGKKVGYICYLTTENEPYILVSISPYKWEKLGGTNLSIATTGTTATITSSTGDTVGGANAVTIPAATASAAGLLTSAQHSKLTLLVISNQEALTSAAETTTAPSQDAVKKYVTSYVGNAVAGALRFMGGYNASTNTPAISGTPTFVQTGYAYVVTAAGLFYTEAVEIGDMIIAQAANPTTAAGWTIVNKNIPAILTGTQATAGLLRIGSGTAGDTDVAAHANHQHEIASQYNDGFMSMADRVKLDGLAAGGYTHPSYAEKTSGLYKITVDNLGHVSAATAVAKADITALGIPASDTNTTYAFADGANGKFNVTPSGGSLQTVNVYTHPATDGDLHVPATGTTNNGKVLKAGGTAGSIAWGTLTAADVSAAPSSHVGSGGTAHADAVAGGAAGFMTGADKTKLDGITAGANVRKFITTLATSATSIAVNHALNTRDVIVQAYYLATYEHVECDVVATDVNNVTLSFATAPAANSIRVTVIG